jgi:hypothetical protein
MGRPPSKLWFGFSGSVTEIVIIKGNQFSVSNKKLYSQFIEFIVLTKDSNRGASLSWWWCSMLNRLLPDGMSGMETAIAASQL